MVNSAAPAVAHFEQALKGHGFTRAVTIIFSLRLYSLLKNQGFVSRHRFSARRIRIRASLCFVSGHRFVSYQGIALFRIRASL
jgi:hypothetical protein